MGLMGAIGAGLAEVGNAGQQIGMKYVADAIEADREKRLEALRLEADAIKRTRDDQAREAKATRMKAETGRLGDEALLKSFMQDKGMTEEDVAEDRQGIIASLKEGGNYAPDEIAKARLRADAAMNVGDKDEENAARGMLGMALNEKRADAQDAVANRRADIQEMLAQKQIDAQNRATRMAEVRESNMNAREQRAATAKALDGTTADIKSLEKEAVDPNLADEQRKVVQRQLSSLRDEAARYRAALSKAGLPLADEPKRTPSDEVRYDAKGNAYKRGADGKPELVTPKKDAPAASPPAEPKIEFPETPYEKWKREKAEKTAAIIRAQNAKSAAR